MSRNTALITDAAQAAAQQELDAYARGVADHINGDWGGHVQMQVHNQPYQYEYSTPWAQQAVTTRGFSIPWTVPGIFDVYVSDTFTIRAGTIQIGVCSLTVTSVDQTNSKLTVRNDNPAHEGLAGQIGSGVFALGWHTETVSQLLMRMLLTDTITGAVTDVAATCPAILFGPAVSPSNLPIIGLQPQSITVNAGTSFTLTVYAVSQLPLAYQWMLNEVPIQNANARSLYIPSATKPIGITILSYTVAVSNQNGTVLSIAAVVTVT